MFYIHHTATAVIALVLIFQDDHDNTYDRNGDTRPAERPDTNTKPGMVREISWSYLYSLEYDEDICGDATTTLSTPSLGRFC